MLGHKNTSLALLSLLIVVLCKCSRCINEDQFRPIFPAKNVRQYVGGRSWTPSTNFIVENSYDSHVRTFDSSNRNKDNDQPRIFNDNQRLKIDDGENLFAPKPIPIMRNDAMPIIHRDMLYDHRSLPYSSQYYNESQEYFQQADISNEKKNSEAYDEDFSTYMTISNIARALSVIENSLTIEDDEQSQGRGKIGKKYRKYMLPLLLAYKLKFFALIPLMMGGLVLLAGSTGFAGFFFALFAATMGLKVGGHN